MFSMIAFTVNKPGHICSLLIHPVKRLLLTSNKYDENDQQCILQKFNKNLNPLKAFL